MLPFYPYVLPSQAVKRPWIGALVFAVGWHAATVGASLLFNPQITWGVGEILFGLLAMTSGALGAWHASQPDVRP